MKNNHIVITFLRNIHKVITLSLNNNKVITYHKSKHKVITKLLLYYIVITFSFPVWALSFDSDLVEGKLIFGHLDTDESLFIEESYLNIGKNGKNLFKIPTDSHGRFAIGIPQDATQITLTLNNGTTSKQKIFSIKPRPWDEDYVTGLPSEKVTPNQKNQDRIAKESLQMRLARQTSTYPDFPQNWVCPVPEYKRISSHFGSRRILNNVKKQGHSGTDLAAPIGTTVIAPADGRVAFIHPDMFLTGKTILIDHGFGILS